MPYRVEEYVRADGSAPYRKWFDALPSDAATKVAVAKQGPKGGGTIARGANAAEEITDHGAHS